METTTQTKVNDQSFLKEILTPSQLKKATVIMYRVIAVVRSADKLKKHWITPDEILTQMNFMGRLDGSGELTMNDLMIIIDACLSLFNVKKEGENPHAGKIAELRYYTYAVEGGE